MFDLNPHRSPPERFARGRAVPTVVLTITAVVLAAPLFGEETASSDLSERVRRTESLVLEGKYSAALELARPLADEIADRAGVQDSDRRAVGTAASLLALAEAGVGDLEAAAWHWAIATKLRPDLETVPLEGYGTAGAAIAAGLAKEAAEDAAEAEKRPPLPAEASGGQEPSPEAPPAGSKIEPARRVQSPSPQATAALRASGADEVVIVRFVLGADGRLRRPEILRTRWPGYAFSILETLRREWRFEPVKRSGEPVAAYYTQTVSFEGRKKGRRPRRPRH